MKLAVAVGLLAAVALLFAAANTPVNDGYGEMVLVPAGAFKMGDNFNEGDPRERLEGPGLYRLPSRSGGRSRDDRLR